MCHQCDYTQLLEEEGLSASENRLKVLEIIGSSNSPLSAQDVYAILNRTDDINRVTIYRILDLLVENNILDRLTSGGRSFLYGMAPNEHHPRHPHFYCRNCGNMECLNPESLHLDLHSLERTFPGQIDSVEVRVDGICRTCLKAG